MESIANYSESIIDKSLGHLIPMAPFSLIFVLEPDVFSLQRMLDGGVSHLLSLSHTLPKHFYICEDGCMVKMVNDEEVGGFVFEGCEALRC